MNDSDPLRPLVSSEDELTRSLKEKIERSLLPKSFQHVIINFLKNKKTFTPDFLKTIKSLYKEAESSCQSSLEEYESMGHKPLQLVCKKGCRYCCGLTVKATIPELYLIFEYIQDKYDETQIHQIIADLRDYQKKMELCETRNEKLKVPCGFLKNDVCSIYEVRPLPCHAWNSTDLQSCVDYLTNYDIEIPSSLCHYTPYDIVKKGIMKGLYIAGFKEVTEELNSGILRMLEWEYEDVVS